MKVHSSQHANWESEYGATLSIFLNSLDMTFKVCFFIVNYRREYLSVFSAFQQWNLNCGFFLPIQAGMIASISSYVTDQPYLNLKILVWVLCKAVSQPSSCVGICEVVYVVHREVNQDWGFGMVFLNCGSWQQQPVSEKVSAVLPWWPWWERQRSEGVENAPQGQCTPRSRLPGGPGVLWDPAGTSWASGIQVMKSIPGMSVSARNREGEKSNE